MKINLTMGQTNLLDFSKIHQSSFNKNDNNNSKQLSKVEPTDRVNISPQGKKNNLLDNLMKQKLRITEQKDALVSSTLEKGKTLDTIKSQLEVYAEQMKNIDEQIAEITAKEIDKQTESLKNKVDDKPKTEEEIKNEQLNSITILSTNLQQTKTISSVQNKIEGSTRVTEVELKADKMRGLSGEAIAKKEKNIDKMEKKLSDLNAKISDSLSELSQKINKSNQSQEILPDDENNSTDQTKESDDKAKFSPIQVADGSAEKSVTEKVVAE